MDANTDEVFESHPTFANLFNVTYNFASDATVYFPYGRVIDRQIPHLKDVKDNRKEGRASSWLSPPAELPQNILDLDFGHKTKDILWMVSHCDTDSKREVYVEQLKKLTNLTIDVLGKCGKDVLSKSETTSTIGKAFRKQSNKKKTMFF